jgi:hypothetical protein
MKADGKQGNRLTEISDYIGNRREMKDRKLVPVSSLSQVIYLFFHVVVTVQTCYSSPRIIWFSLVLSEG